MNDLQIMLPDQISSLGLHITLDMEKTKFHTFPSKTVCPTHIILLLSETHKNLLNC